jgi:hypothetical protein
MGATHLLLYQPIETSGDWRPLLQQQAVLAVSRAVAAYRDALLAPADPDVITLLATTARDRSQARPERPVHVYGEPDASIQPLLAQTGWFNVVGRSLSNAIQRLTPQSCIILGDKQFVLENSVPSPAQRVLYLRALTGRDFVAPASVVAADADLDLQVGGRSVEGATATPWSFPEVRALDLEPFIALGLAFERALWDAGGPR